MLIFKFLDSLRNRILCTDLPPDEVSKSSAPGTSNNPAKKAKWAANLLSDHESQHHHCIDSKTLSFKTSAITRVKGEVDWQVHNL